LLLGGDFGLETLKRALELIIEGLLFGKENQILLLRFSKRGIQSRAASKTAATFNQTWSEVLGSRLMGLRDTFFEILWGVVKGGLLLFIR
jgi:hypothetical protein